MTDHSQHDPGKSPAEGSPEELERDAVWKLLLKARKPEVSPFFARNVLREVRGLEGRQSAGFSWGSLFTFPRIAFAGAAAILLAVILIVNGGAPEPAVVDSTPVTTPPMEIVTGPPAAPEVDEADGFDMGDYQEEIEMIDYLDGLLAVQDVESLDDAALAEILF